MKIDELLHEDRIILDLAADNKFEVIRILAEKMTKAEEVVDIARLTEDIIKREEEIPTGLEHGTAIPHARSSGVKELVLSFARLEKGVDFSSMDKEPVRLVFQFGVPPDQISQYLKILAKLSRLLKKTEIREKLLNAKSPREISDAFRGK